MKFSRHFYWVTGGSVVVVLLFFTWTCVAFQSAAAEVLLDVARRHCATVLTLTAILLIARS